MNLVAAQIALAGVALLATVVGMLRTRMFQRNRPKQTPLSGATMDRIARIRQARDARFGRRRR